MRYTFSDEEDETSEAGSIRRSTRQAQRETSAEPKGPTVTASGRQVRSRAAGLYGESLLSGQTTEGASPATGDYVRSDVSEEPQRPHNRATRSNGDTNGWNKGRKHIETYNSVDEMDDEDDATSWDGGDEEEDEADPMDLEDDDDVADDASEGEEPKTLVVQLKYRKGSHDGTDKATKPEEPSAPPPDQQNNGGASAHQPALDSSLPSKDSIKPEQQPAAKDANKPAVAENGPLSPGSHDLPTVQPTFSAPTPPYASPKDGAPKPIDPLNSPFQKQTIPSTTSAAAWN